MSHVSLDQVADRLSGRWRIAGSLLLLLALIAPSTAQAQGGQQQALQEWRQIRQQLSQIRQRALQDSALQARQQKLVEYIRSEMRSVDDPTAARVDSMVTLQEDLRAAQQGQDTAGAMAAARELKRLQKAVGPARKKVMSQPEVQKRIKAFQKALRATMREINPKTDSLQKRAAEIRAQLQGGSGGGR